MHYLEYYHSAVKDQEIESLQNALNAEVARAENLQEEISSLSNAERDLTEQLNNEKSIVQELQEKLRAKEEEAHAVSVRATEMEEVLKTQLAETSTH